MKTLVISSKFYPLMDGLSDYTSNFVKTLANHSQQEVAVLSHSKAELEGVNNISFYHSGDSWSFISLYRALRRIISEFKPNTILIEFVPYMYGRAGINFSLPLIIFLLSFFRKDIKIQLMFHELWYPCFLKEPKSWVIHPSHKISVWILGMVSDKIFCSTENFVHELSSFLPLKRARLNHLPVPSNIVEDSKTDGLSKKEGCLNLVHFGMLHSSKSSYELFSHLTERMNSKIIVNFIGITDNDALDFFGKEVFERLRTQAVFHGKLNPIDVVNVFSASDLMLAYYIDGATTRRGSLMAAMKYGLPILTNLSETTDKILIEAPINFSQNSIESYCLKLIELVENPGLIKNNNIEIIEYYDRHFSWEKTLEIFLQR